MKVQRWISKAIEVLELYKKHRENLLVNENSQPFHLFLQQFYKDNKNIGSKDRKAIRSLCYAYFRVFLFFEKDSDIHIIFKIGIFLSAKTSNNVEDDLLKHFLPEAYSLVDNTNVKEKIAYMEKVHKVFSVNNFKNNTLIQQIFKDENMMYHLFDQPLLFVRAKRKYSEAIEDELINAQIFYSKNKDFPNSFVFENGTDLTVISKFKGKYEIQDLSSQYCVDKVPVEIGENWWDCCAGSGGKSLALLDKFENFNLSISDKREAIVKNLNIRLKNANINKLEGRVVDLTQKIPFEKNYFDGILADVPCSGSGTWLRNPENLIISNKNYLSYPKLQMSILKSINPYLKSGGKLVYITCSLFDFENELLVESFVKENSFKILKMNYYKGFEMGADCMFYAILQKE
jgi:16S rRNA (cytosine967-C5)-methyltransferase